MQNTPPLPQIQQKLVELESQNLQLQQTLTQVINAHNRLANTTAKLTPQAFLNISHLQRKS